MHQHTVGQSHVSALLDFSPTRFLLFVHCGLSALARAGHPSRRFSDVAVPVHAGSVETLVGEVDTDSTADRLKAGCSTIELFPNIAWCDASASN